MTNKNKKQNKTLLLVLSLVLSTCLTSTVKASSEHQHQAVVQSDKKIDCQVRSVKCAKTVTSAFSPKGELWRLWSFKESLYIERSKDKGENFSAPLRVDIPFEKISSRNENRPKIAFDNTTGVYLSWAMPREKKYTADVRFSYSIDGGKSFSKPITVNNDNLLAGHSFNELLVTPKGDISIVWLDSRFSTALKKQGKTSNGSALFLAKANMRKGTSFTEQKLANETCVCCRIAMDFNLQDQLTVLWRHIYGDNIREFALLTVLEGESKNKQIQISHDYWKINGCPHQGGGISIDENNRHHLVWFNQGDKGKGVFYAYSDDQGNTLSKPLSVGNFSAQAAHPHVLVTGKEVDVIWTEFNGITHQLMHQKSINSGKIFNKAEILAVAYNGADRPFIINHQGKNYVSWQRPKQGHWIQAL